MSLLPCVRAPKLLPTVPKVSVPFYVLVCPQAGRVSVSDRCDAATQEHPDPQERALLLRYERNSLENLCFIGQNRGVCPFQNVSTTNAITTIDLDKPSFLQLLGRNNE